MIALPEALELLGDERTWMAIGTACGGIGFGAYHTISRLRSKRVELETPDGKLVSARFQNQQGEFITTLVDALKNCNDNHEKCTQQNTEWQRLYTQVLSELQTLTRMRGSRASPNAGE